METACIFVALLCLVSSRVVVHHPLPLKEFRHLQALQQPHLPQDQNVIAATQQFLHRFAQLKALADAAPDDPVYVNHQQHVAHNHHHNQRVPIPHNQILHQQHIVYTPQQHYQQQQQQQPQQALVILHQPQARHHPVQHHQQATNQHINMNIPVVNSHGIVVNPNRYPGPLAHALPANVVHAG